MVVSARETWVIITDHRKYRGHSEHIEGAVSCAFLASHPGFNLGSLRPA